MGKSAQAANVRPYIPVAEYVRMSTDLQMYSPAAQAAAISDFADAHGMRVVRTYLDEAKSGLEIGRREALQQLLADVRSGSAGFEAILVYDVSRWGRFQNADEAAYYEFICTRAGIRIHYVAEPFANDGSPLSAVLKSLKRAMAAEYSRELSAKVFAGHCRLVERGFRQGGSAGYGLRRMLVGADGKPKGLLADGERKSLATDRVILVPGPKHEVSVIRSIFRDYCAGLRTGAIASKLNARNIPNVSGRPWRRQHILAVVSSEKYAGVNVYGKTSQKLQQPRVSVPEASWVQTKHAYASIISMSTFNAAASRIRLMRRTATDEELLAPIRAVLAREGYLSNDLIEREVSLRSRQTYARRFGSLRNLYERVGFDPGGNHRYCEARRHSVAMQRDVMGDLRGMLQQFGHAVESSDNGLLVDAGFLVSVAVLRPRVRYGHMRWYLRQRISRPEFIVFVRLTERRVGDFILWPCALYGWLPREVSTESIPWIELYKLGSVEEVVRMLCPEVRSTPRLIPLILDDPSVIAVQAGCSRALGVISDSSAVLAMYPGSLSPEMVRSIVRLIGFSQGELQEGVQAVWQFSIAKGHLTRLLQHTPLTDWLQANHGGKLKELKVASEFVGLPVTDPSIAIPSAQVARDAGPKK
jgi:DNA invertase Pin-like site-specific DNA recombinase